MQKRRLGKLEVSALGFGCLELTSFYGQADQAESTATFERALELGCTFLDTADRYSDGANELFMAPLLKGRRDKVVLATKFGNSKNAKGVYETNGRPEYVPQACDANLKRLGVDVIDLYYQHRLDPNVPVEDTVGAMGRLVEQGKVRFLGLCEVSSQTLRRAHAAFPITAVQSEYSLFSRDIEASVIPTCRELNVGIVPYSPLGRGFLTGTFANIDTLDKDDKRRGMPRFQPENIEHNKRLVGELANLAKAENCAPAQLAIAWILAQGDDIVPIPGTKRRKWLEQNVAAADLKPSKATLAKLDEIFRHGAAAGERNSPASMQRIEA